MSAFTDLALVAMERKAMQLRVSGVAIIATFQRFPPILGTIDVYVIGQKLSRDPDLEGHGADDIGTNYLGFALGKLAQSVRTGKPSGPEEIRKGESGKRGCVLTITDSEFGVILCSFSGGTEEQDVQIAESGIHVIEEELEAKKKYS